MSCFIALAAVVLGFGSGEGSVTDPRAVLNDQKSAVVDENAVEPIDPSKAPVVITRQFLVPAKISSLQYGQFVEYLCNLVPAMWAEKLYDGSFEGLSPYKVAYLQETDFRERPWYPSGSTNRAVYVRAPSTRTSGRQCLRITAWEDTPATVSVAQDGIAVEPGLACTFSCYLKQSGLRSAVRVRLHHEGTIHARCELHPTGEWEKYRARLVPAEMDANATLTIEFRGPATLWLDNASLMPENAKGGWRSDVVEAVRALEPGIIRFGGSALDDPNLGQFEWRDTIGDPDLRRPFRAWGGLQPTGPGLEELVQFCRMVGAEPLLCIRVNGRKPEDAAAQVQYFNGSAATPMGAVRAKNGHAEPYRIQYWQVGNERSGQAYEAQLPEFCQAMKRSDPSIELLSSYPTPGVLDRAAPWLDYVAPHHYDCANLTAEESDLVKVRRMLEGHAKGKPIKVAVTEWNTTGGDWGPTRARLWTLENALACSRYHNLLHRNCDLVAIACRSNLINSFCSGIIQTDNHRLYKTPTYYAQQLYATIAGDRPLRIESPLAAASGPDLSATLAPQSDHVVLLAVNSGSAAITRPLDFTAFAPKRATIPPIAVWTLADTKSAGEPDVTNSFSDPERIVPRRSTFTPASAKFAYRFPAYSLTVIRWAGSAD
jgi:alpha-N-arabinofuranosidase